MLSARVDSCEALVVGAGLVGAAVASSLAREGLDVAVLEARDVAGGATSHTIGLVRTGFPIPYTEMIERHGREKAQELWQLLVENRAIVKTVGERLGVPVERTGSLTVATSEEEADVLESSAKSLSEDGFDVQWEADDPLKRGFAAALRYPEDGTLDPVALTEALLEGIPTHKDTEVYGLKDVGDDVLVLARGRTVRTDTVVLAVNAYAPLLDAYFADKVSLARGYLFSTHPLEENLIATPGSSGSFSFRQTGDGRLLFSAWRSEYQMPATSVRDQGIEVELMQFIGHYFPEASNRLNRRRSNVTAFARDNLPLIGALPHLPQVFFAAGFGAYGLGLAFTVADALTNLIVRGAEHALLSAQRLE